MKLTICWNTGHFIQNQNLNIINRCIPEDKSINYDGIDFESLNRVPSNHKIN